MASAVPDQNQKQQSPHYMKQVDTSQDDAQLTLPTQLELLDEKESPRVEKKSYLRKTFVDDKLFWTLIVVLLLANIGLHRNTFTGRWFGFILASYSAIANDSIQTLGAFIASNTGVVKWWKQWIWISTVFLGTTLYSWAKYDGDISYQRLESKGYDTAPESFNYLQTACTIVLLILTRLKIPVSTTFMILTLFVTEPEALGKTITKSVMGYGISFGLAILVYLPFCKFVTDYCDKTRGKLSKIWSFVQWMCTGVLWSTWLMQDMSNVAVFLPRSLSVVEICFVCTFITSGLGIMLWQGGDKIQQVVDEKSRVKDIPEGTLIDFLYATILFVFITASNIPMSTTWSFVGLLAGREISQSLRKVSSKTLNESLKMSAKDLVSVTLGFIVSLLIGIGGNQQVFQSIKELFN